MSAPFPLRAPAHYLQDVLVLFEDVDLCPGTNTAFTWRACVAYRDPDDWIVDDIQLDVWGEGWVNIADWHPLRAILVARTYERDLRKQVDTAIIEDMDRRGLFQDDGWSSGEKLSAVQMGIGR